MQHRQSFSSYIKSTLFSGIFFLIPLLIIFYGIGRIKIYMAEIAAAISPNQHIETWSGLLLANISAILIFMLIAFFVGLIVRLSIFRTTRHTLSDFVAKIFPTYAFIKAYTEDLAAVDKSSATFIPVMVDLGSNSRLGFQVDQFENGKVSIYLPGTPNPWSGSICYVDSSQCETLNISLHDAIDYCRMPGNHHTHLARLLRGNVADKNYSRFSEALRGVKED